MFGNAENKRLYGAWEERGVLGSRIEIDKKTVTVLWRGAPVLTSGYKTEETEDGRLVVLPEKRGMRYERDVKDYAQVVEISEKDGRLLFVEDFPISGRSEVTMTKTDRNRYGDYDVVTEQFAKELAGTWSDEGGYFKMTFRGSTMKTGLGSYRIVVLRRRYDQRIIIHDEDPSKDLIDGLANIEFAGTAIHAMMPVCDAQPHYIELKKK